MTFSALAVSNIAWPAAEWAGAVGLLKAHGVSGIEIAPWTTFGTWEVADSAILAFKARLDDEGLRCLALQGIVYNAPDVSLFVSAASRRALFNHLRQVARMAGLLGATACVFGAPRQRDPGGLDPAAAWDIAVAFFRSIAPVFADHGAAISFEANARSYGCRFITGTAEAARFVADVDRPGCKLQIDTGTMVLEAEDPAVLREVTALAAHAHVSEPGLAPIGQTGTDHAAMAAALRAAGYQRALSIEMKATQDWKNALDQALGLVLAIYGR